MPFKPYDNGLLYCAKCSKWWRREETINGRRCPWCGQALRTRPRSRRHQRPESKSLTNEDLGQITLDKFFADQREVRILAR